MTRESALQIRLACGAVGFVMSPQEEKKLRTGSKRKLSRGCGPVVLHEHVEQGG